MISLCPCAQSRYALSINIAPDHTITRAENIFHAVCRAVPDAGRDRWRDAVMVKAKCTGLQIRAPFRINLSDLRPFRSSMSAHIIASSARNAFLCHADWILPLDLRYKACPSDGKHGDVIPIRSPCDFRISRNRKPFRSAALRRRHVGQGVDMRPLYIFHFSTRYRCSDIRNYSTGLLDEASTICVNFKKFFRWKNEGERRGDTMTR